MPNLSLGEHGCTVNDEQEPVASMLLPPEQKLYKVTENEVCKATVNITGSR